MKDMVAEPSAAAVGGGTPGLGEREEGSDVCPCLGCSMRTGEVLRTGVSELVVSVAVEAGGLGSELWPDLVMHAEPERTEFSDRVAMTVSSSLARKVSPQYSALGQSLDALGEATFITAEKTFWGP